MGGPRGGFGLRRYRRHRRGMAIALCFNPGSNSLKFELVEGEPGSERASQLRKLASAAIDDIGKDAGKLSVYKGREVVGSEPCKVEDMRGAVEAALRWLRGQKELRGALAHLAFAAVRVVHGGATFAGPAQATAEVRAQIERLEELAPLHNRSSLEILEVLDRELPGVRMMVTFDTSFHRTLPEVAWRYPIERTTADRFGVRKFGFHGLSHRYMLMEYAAVAGKPPEQCTLVTLHLESGCSACAIREGVSVDTTMGMTPLEGLMMGSRSGSVDPAIVPFLMQKQQVGGQEVMQLLNKRSGMLGIAGGTLDTRELVKREDPEARLSLEMFSYRVRLAVGAYLAALGERCEAVVFGGGIGEDSPWLRKAVCAGLGGWGLEMDEEVNADSAAGQARVSKEGSGVGAWAMPVVEELEMAWECFGV